MIFYSFLISFLSLVSSQSYYYNSLNTSQSVFLTHITALLRVTAVTTYIPTTTTFVTNHVTYKITDAPTMLTITDCPCDMRTDVTIPATPVTRTITYATYLTVPTNTITTVNNLNQTVIMSKVRSTYTLFNFVATKTNAVIIIPTGYLPGQYVTVTIDPPYPTATPGSYNDPVILIHKVYIIGERELSNEEGVVMTSIYGVGNIAFVTFTASSMRY